MFRQGTYCMLRAAPGIRWRTRVTRWSVSARPVRGCAELQSIVSSAFMLAAPLAAPCGDDIEYGT